MARAIDADRLLLVLEKNFGHTGGAAVMRQLIEIQPTLPQPSNEALICDGCLWAEMGALEKCSSCMRGKKDNYYRRPPEGEA
jgi:hypothetical protein